jgi:carbon storage regulator CsrA
MVVLSCRVNDRVCLLEANVTVRVLSVGGGKVRLGIEVPPQVTIRQETHHRESTEAEEERQGAD